MCIRDRAVIYSGEALYCHTENPNLEYVIPKEGSNLWIDSWVIPKNAKHKENAEAFINYMCQPEIAKMNFDYITYSIPNSAGQALIEEPEYRESQIALDVYKRQLFAQCRLFFSFYVQR